MQIEKCDKPVMRIILILNRKFLQFWRKYCEDFVKLKLFTYKNIVLWFSIHLTNYYAICSDTFTSFLHREQSYIINNRYCLILLLHRSNGYVPLAYLVFDLKKNFFPFKWFSCAWNRNVVMEFVTWTILISLLLLSRKNIEKKKKSFKKQILCDR